MKINPSFSEEVTNLENESKMVYGITSSLSQLNTFCTCNEMKKKKKLE